MKRRIISVLLAGAAGICLSLGLAACNNGGGGGEIVDKPGKVEDFDVSGPPDYVGESIENTQLTFQKKDGQNAYIVTGIQEDAQPKDLVIPNTYDSLPVTEIAESAFNGHSEIESVNIAGSVTAIGGSAFSSCGGIRSVRIPASVQTLGESAFLNCVELRAVIFAEDSALESIGANAFGNCKALAKFSVPAQVKQIGNQAFYNCTSLLNITIGNGVQTIGSEAFAGCEKLASVDFGTGVKTIDNKAFAECKALTEIVVPDSVDTFGEDVFLHCISIEKMTIPFVGATREFANLNKTDQSMASNDGDTAVGSGSVEKSHFGYLFGAPGHAENDQKNGDFVPAVLKYVKVTGGNRIADNAFMSMYNLETIILADSITLIGHTSFGYCSDIKVMVLGSGLTSLGTAVLGYSANDDGREHKILYNGTADSWASVSIDNGDPGNAEFASQHVYFYSETEQDARHWRYVEDMPTVW